MAKDDTSDRPKKKRSKLKTLFVFLFIVLLLGGGGYAAWTFFLEDMYNKAMSGTDTPAATEEQQNAAAPPQPMGTTIPLPEFTVNLADPLGQRFIKLSVEVEVSDPKVAQDMEKQKARIRDSIIMLLSSKAYADIATTESKIVLKGEITSRLTNILGQGKVYQVFITDMVIQ